jgi:hypothetical protein
LFIIKFYYFIDSINLFNEADNHLQSFVSSDTSLYFRHRFSHGSIKRFTTIYNDCILYISLLSSILYYLLSAHHDLIRARHRSWYSLAWRRDVTTLTNICYLYDHHNCNNTLHIIVTIIMIVTFIYSISYHIVCYNY